MTSEIASRRNDRVKALKRLVLDPGERRRHGACVIEGVRVAADYLACGCAVDEALVSPRLSELEGGEALLATLRSRVPDDRLIRVTDDVLSSLSDARSSQGLLLRVPRPDTSGLPEADGRPVLVAWEIQDPGNAGSMARTAEAAGCAAFVVAAGPAGALVDVFSPKSVRAAAASSFRVRTCEWRGEPAELAAALRRAGYRMAASTPRAGVAPESADLSGPVAVLVGAETRGLPEELEAAEVRITVPLEGACESLNAAAAAAVVLFEAARQRRAGGAPG